MKILSKLLFVLIALQLCFYSSVARAQKKSLKICSKTIGSKTIVRARKNCKAKKGWQELDLSTLRGADGKDGANGKDGADGQLRIYGDGSAGSRTVSLSTTLGADGNYNYQFVDFTVNSGVTLTVRSGTIIRCSGTFTNNGTITVDTGANGGFTYNVNGSAVSLAANEPQPGHARRAAQNGEIGDNSLTRKGGKGGNGLTVEAASQLLAPGLYGGGGGGADGAGLQNIGSAGGGSFTVLAKQGIVNAGTISADGQTLFGGGGGGGIIILASKNSIDNTGAITAKGGNGDNSSSNQGAGGGGGGGIVHLLAPVISDTGTINVSGGLAGTAGAAGSVTANPRTGGGGGGGCGGSGGAGGQVNTAGDPGTAANGGDGYIFKTAADPTALF
ncbi:MAG: hypothetical protein D6719_13715 [Candidatus Dadabacteria bacterium]|nr:MAG: hypothetical protein D6719_13715 [Candidatus Dadabacteria bacterium]